MKKYNIIYKLTNIKNGMIYIGAHSTDNLHDNYMGSGVKLKEAQISDKFSKEILFDYDNPYDMYKKEWELVNIDFINNINTYNTVVGGSCCITNSEHTTGHIYVFDEYDNKIKVPLDDYKYQWGIYETCSLRKFRLKWEKQYKGRKPYDPRIRINNGITNKEIPLSKLKFFKELGWNRGCDKSLYSQKHNGMTGKKKMISPTGEYLFVNREEQPDLMADGWKFALGDS